MAWLRTRAPNGDRAGVSRCSKGDHEGHIREVPQEEGSPSMYIVQIVCISKRGISTLLPTLLQVSLENQHPRSQCYVVDIFVNLLIPASTLLSFPLYKICHIIIGVYFRRLKINHESHEFILDPGTVANSYSATIRILINPTSRTINSRNRKAACGNSVPSKNGEMVSI